MSSPFAPLFRTIYISSVTPPAAEGLVQQILEQSRRNNPALGVTGILITCGDEFFQVLEGPQPAIRALVRRIGEDPRHCHLVTLVDEPVEERLFAEWTMAYGVIDSSELQEMAPQMTLGDLHSGLTKDGGVMTQALLKAFLLRVRARFG